MQRAALVALLLLLTSCEFTFRAEQQPTEPVVKLCAVQVHMECKLKGVPPCYEPVICQVGVSEAQKAEVQSWFQAMEPCP